MNRPALATLAVATVVVLSACSGGNASHPAPSASPSTSGRTNPVGRLDIGGGQAYGLALTGDSVWATSYDAGTVVRIDPATSTVAQTVNVPGGAAFVLADGDVLWVAGYGGPGQPGTLSRVSGGAVVASTSPGEICCDLSVGNGSLWVVDPSGAVMALNRADGTVAHRFPVPLDRNVHSNAVFGGGSVWVASDSGPLYRMNPNNGHTSTVDVGGGVPFMVAGDQLWGARPDAVWAVDLTTGELARTVTLADSIEVMALAVTAEDIWVGLRHPGRVGAVVRLELTSGLRKGETPVDVPARIEVGFAAAWVADSGSQNVVRIAL